MQHVIVVGQTPPPYGGQAIMIQRLLEQTYEGVELHHVRMAFSREMNEVGNFHVRKIGHLIALVLRIIARRLGTGARILYYPPAGPDRIPVYRDILVLICVRWMFDKTIFHFEAGGLTDIYESLNRVERALFRTAYRRPHVAIRLSDLLPEDGKRLDAVRELIVPNAIPDLDVPTIKRPRHDTPVILFVGVVRASKGVAVLLEAAGHLKERGISFKLDIVGEAATAEFEREAHGITIRYGIEDDVAWRGLLIDSQKDEAYERADIFCFPSFFESETTPIVVMEAMRAGLPVVSTHWRGIAEMVQDGTTGILVPIKDPIAVAGALERLISDEQLRLEMGAEGRRAYEERFTIDRYRDGIQRAFHACTDL